MRRFLALGLLLSLLGAIGCASGNNDNQVAPASTGAQTAEDTGATPESSSFGMGSGPGMGMGPGSGMMARHHAQIPSEYAGLTNPIALAPRSLEAGETLYTTHCATCHGDGGMGDGPAASGLDPAPAPIAHTSQMLGDDYLFWRISEGGNMAPFDSAMPAWADALEPEERWHVINYVRALGSGTAPPGSMNGATYDPTAEATRRDEMLAEAVKQDVIDEGEAELFSRVHEAMDDLRRQGMPPMSGGMAANEEAALARLVRAGTISAEDAAAFTRIHDTLVSAGLMQ